MLDFRAEQLNRIQQKAVEEEHKRLVILKRIQEYDALLSQAFTDQQSLMTSQTLDLAQAQNFPHYVMRLKQQRFQEFQRLQAQEQQLNIIREALKQAHIQNKSLELLKEKDQVRYRKVLEKAEEEFLAELALMRSQRTGA